MKVLVVDDEKIKRIPLRDDLREANYDAIAVESPAIGLKLLEQEHFDVLVTDLRMPKMHGIDFLKRAKRDCPYITVIIMTAYATVETAVEAMKFGAHNYIKKPFSSGELITMLEKLKVLRQKDRGAKEWKVQLSRDKIEQPLRYHNIIGKSRQMQEIFNALDTASDSRSSVLICGERGVGKALLAKRIHMNSPRKHQPYTEVNCGGIALAALEESLFGRELGVGGQRTGQLELAHGGTLFLADIENLPSDIQIKLLKVLEDGEFERSGKTDRVRVDVRLTAATTGNLREKVKCGEFREDLFYRLNVIPLFVPPLRERVEDIPLLMNHFLDLFTPNQNVCIAREAIDILMAYPWPSNVGELENVIERLVTLSGGRDITAEDIPVELKLPMHVHLDDTLGETSFHEIVHSTERELIAWAMRKTQGNKTRSAQLLKMKPSTFRDALAKYVDEIEWEV